MDEEFKVSKNLLKTITVDTRVNILKSLENRPMTASELSRFLNKHVTTISEHLDLLKNSNLVERIERPGRKWIYYKLTRDGKKILNPRSYRFVMVFSLLFLVFVGSWFIWTVDAYPGQILYGLKRGRENLQLILTPTNLGRAQKHIQFAEERLKETKMITEKGEETVVENMIDDYKKEIIKARKELEIARMKKKNIVPVLESMSEATGKHVLILENLVAKAPALRKKIQPSLNISIETYETTVKDLQNITGIPYASAITSK